MQNEAHPTWGGKRENQGRPKGSKNKKPAQGRKTIFKTFSVSCLPTEYDTIKMRAEARGKTISRYLVELALSTEN